MKKENVVFYFIFNLDKMLFAPRMVKKYNQSWIEFSTDDSKKHCFISSYSSHSKPGYYRALNYFRFKINQPTENLKIFCYLSYMINNINKGKAGIKTAFAYKYLTAKWGPCGK